MKIDSRAVLQIVLTMSVSLLSSGCSESGSSSDPGADGSEVLASELEIESEEDSKPPEGIPYKLQRDIENVYGAWLLYLHSESSELPLGIVIVSPLPDTDPVEYRVDFQTLNKEATVYGVIRSEVSPDRLEFALRSEKDERVLMFQGRLQDSIVYGNMIGVEGLMCTSARMVSPGEGSLQEEPQPHLVAGISDLSEVLQGGADWEDLVQFVRGHPESPLIPNALLTLAAQAGPRKIPAEQITELLELIDESTRLWGERLTKFVRLSALLQLSNDYHHPDLLASILASLEGNFEEPVWKAPAEFMMQNLRKDIDQYQLVNSLRQADEQQRNEIIEQIQETIDANRFDIKLLIATAQTLSELSDKTSAIEWYQKLVAVPGMEGRYLGIFNRFAKEIPVPSKQLAELWNEVHGSEEGLQETLEREYEKLIAGYPLPEFELPEPNGKQVLIELFTGASCTPCIAADLAFTIVGDQFPTDRVVLLQYHVHVPAFDPLTCQESQARYGYYNPEGTPTTIISGRIIPGLAGDASLAPAVLQPIVDEIVEELSLDPILQIDASVTPTADGTSTFEAAVKADQISERWRLHVALAEGEVKYQGMNGVPIHEMVVRKLFTSSQGLEPTGGTLAMQGKIDPTAIRKHLKQQMATLRESRGLQFEDGPLDLDDLFLVVFVQDVQNHRVRQVVSVPVPSSSTVSSVSE